MARTPAQLAAKFAREWLESKPDAIIGYVAVASQLAARTIASKDKMIANFTAVMATTKFEDRLQPYVGSDLMGNAYTQALAAKIVITDAEQLKVERDITLKRSLAVTIDEVIAVYVAQVDSGEVNPPAGVTNQGLRAMLIQGINANQYRLSSGSSAQETYDNTKNYMSTNLGWTVIP